MPPGRCARRSAGQLWRSGSGHRPSTYVIVVESDEPLTREVFELLLAVNFGVNFRALQLATWKGEDRPFVAVAPPAPSVAKPPTVETVSSFAQFVGLSMKPDLLTATLMFLIRSGIPLRIFGSVLSTITWAVVGLRLIVATVTTVPRLKGPAMAGT